MVYKNIWDYFHTKVCLTLDDKRPSKKPSRWPQVEKEFKRVGLTDVKKFLALPAIGPHQSFTLSQKQILTDFINSGVDDNAYLLAFEDDVQFLDLRPLADAIEDINIHKIKWDVLYLGGNLQCTPIKVRRNLFKVTNVWTTHAIAYNLNAVRCILRNFPNENEVMYDNYLGNILQVLNAYMINPMVAIQRPDYSDIWNEQVDYRGVFQASQNKMKL